MTFVSSGSLPLAAQWCARRTAVIAGLYLDFLLEGAYGTLEPASVSSRQQAVLSALFLYYYVDFSIPSSLSIQNLISAKVFKDGLICYKCVCQKNIIIIFTVFNLDLKRLVWKLCLCVFLCFSKIFHEVYISI